MSDVTLHTVPLSAYYVLDKGMCGGSIDLGPLDFKLSPYEIGEYRICRMKIKDMGKGQGTLLMSQLCADADAAQVSLVLEASPYHDRTPKGVARLMRFYGRFGFKQIQGRAHKGCMRRTPSSTGSRG